MVVGLLVRVFTLYQLGTEGLLSCGILLAC
jgi:hypothetical protein